MGTDPLRIDLPWMGSAVALVNPLPEGPPRKVRTQRPAPHEPFFRLDFRGAFSVLSVDVDSLCIITVVDYVLLPFVRCGILSLLFLCTTIPVYRYIDDERFTPTEVLTHRM
jgi:hypothetical protein